MKKLFIFLLSVILTMNCVNLAAQATAPTDFKATPVGISLACHLSWTNPATTIIGEPLTHISKIVLERDNEIIKEFENSQTGEEMNFTDNEIPSVGVYEYAVYAVTAEGEGEKAYATAHCEGALCNFRFVLSEDYGFGWFPTDGIIVIVDGVNYGFINLAWETSYAEEIVSLPSGEVQLYWTGAAFDYYRYHFEVYNPSDELIYTSPDYIMYEGVFFTYQNECIKNIECLPLNDYKGEYIADKNQVHLSWTAPETMALKGFDVYRNDILIDHVAPTIFYSDNTADLEEGDYKYCVVPVYPSVCSLDEECFEMQILNVKEVNNNTIMVYPNPANNVVHISGIEMANVKVLNCMGQLILTQYNTNTINVSGLTNGLYLLTIETSTGQTTQKKLIINHLPLNSTP